MYSRAGKSRKILIIKMFFSGRKNATTRVCHLKRKKGAERLVLTRMIREPADREKNDKTKLPIREPRERGC